MKTAVEIDAEIAALTAMKPSVRQFSAFGDDHHQAIDAQIETLTHRMDTNAVHDAYGDEAMGDDFSENELTAAISASDWMHGLAEDDEPLTADWQTLVK